MCMTDLRKRLYYKRSNANKDKRMDRVPADWTEESVAFLDITDRENPFFRYSF